MEYRVIEHRRDFEQATDLEIAVWGLDPRDAVPVNLMHTLHHAGGALIGAYDGKRLIGIAFALPARRDQDVFLWSHMTGIHPNYQGKGVGFGLKLFQRQWALENGYDTIGWTFDPLQRGNANFNLHRLGATCRCYHENFYGVMQDGINRADLPSDRIEAVWSIRDPHVEERIEGELAEETASDAPFLLRDEGKPIAAPLDDSQPEHLVQIPQNLAQLTSFEALLGWRLALREALVGAFAKGYEAVDFTAENAYLLRHT